MGIFQAFLFGYTVSNNLEYISNRYPFKYVHKMFTRKVTIYQTLPDTLSVNSNIYGYTYEYFNIKQHWTRMREYLCMRKSLEKNIKEMMKMKRFFICLNSSSIEKSLSQVN